MGKAIAVYLFILCGLASLGTYNLYAMAVAIDVPVWYWVVMLALFIVGGITGMCVTYLLGKKLFTK